jgi:transcriptional regulator with XRE-family HTH domain
MQMKERILQRLADLSLSARAASLKAGLNSHFLQKVLAEENKSITTENLRKLAEALETSPEWLLTGTGPSEQDPEIAEIVDIWSRIPEREARKAILDFARWQARKK